MASWRATFGVAEPNDQRDTPTEHRIPDSDVRAQQQDFWHHNGSVQPEFQTGQRQLLHPTYSDPPAAYPAPTPSYKTPSSTPASISTTAENLGRFIHSQCEQELFNTEYLRSNKASGHKNLRCFPHCCGGHNPKSFCGSGLIVECALPHAQLALGRFEEVVKTPLALSARAADALASNADLDAHHTTTNKSTTNKKDTDNQDASESESDATPDEVDDRILVRSSYSRRELLRELKSSENPFGKWFKGVAVLNSQSQAPSQTHGPRFHVNGNRQSWHYGWQSSRLNCKNLHVFKVYFFHALGPESTSDLVECIATVSSPAFRISSSRKARKTFKSSPSLHSLGSVSDDQLSIPQSSPRLVTTTEDDDRLSVDSYESSDGVILQSRPVVTTPMTLAALHHPRQSYTHPIGSARRSFDFNSLQGGGTSSARASGDMLPSIQSRITRASSITAEAAFAHHHQSQYRERKRLIRSASLQSDYFSSMASFASTSPSILLTPTREPRAQTFLGEEPTPPLLQVSRSRSHMLRMDSLLNAQDTSGPEQDYSMRPSLPTISVPLNQSTQAQPHMGPVVTPVADMMQLQLQTPRVVTRTSSTSSIAAVLSSPSPWPTSETSTPLTNGKAKARRKRNRSTDSMGRSLPDNQADANSADAWYEGPLLDEIAPDGDWDLVAQAHALAVAFAVVGRLKEVNKESSQSSYDILWRSSRQQGLGPSVATISSETRPALVTMCAVLAQAASQLIYESSFLVDVRAKLHAFVRESEGTSGPDKSAVVGRCYEAILEFVMARVEAQLTRSMASYEVPSTSTSPSPLVDLLRSAEHELIGELWWRDVSLFDDNDDEYPFAEFVSTYIDAIKASQHYKELEVSRIAGPSRGDLTGEWRLVSLSQNDTRGLSTSTASWMPRPWLHQQLQVYQSQVYRIVETATSVTIALGNSFVSPACPFVAELDQREPLTAIPVDHFPYSPTRHQLLVAYRAWRDTSTSTIIAETMQWPTEADLRVRQASTPASTPSADGQGYQLLRKRLTSYYSVVSSNQIKVRYVVEGSVTENARMCNMAFASPCDGDMVEYFKAPATWELLEQSTLQYERVL